MTMPTDPAHSFDLATARWCALSTGRWLADERWAIDRPAADTKSTGTDMVTEYDRAAEARIVALITERHPDDGIIGEEGTGSAGTSGRHWLIDPIDGTTNFLYGLPGWAVSVAVVDADGGIAGAVYVPAADELFSAVRGGGATLIVGAETATERQRSLHATTTTSLSQALIATGFAYDAQRRADHADHVARFIHEVRDIRRFGAASVDLCHAAAGRVDAYIESRLGPWDIAAGALIAAEAGCQLSDFAGGAASTEQMLCAAPALGEPLRDLLARTR